MLYAANDAGTGGIDLFNSSFSPVSMAGAFATPAAIAAKGLVPFNAEDIGGNVYVTYAPAGHTAQTKAMAGDGAVAVFNESGVLEPSKTIIGGQLASPWGSPSVRRPSATRRRPSGRQLQLRRQSGINAFNPATDAFVARSRSIPAPATWRAGCGR